MPLRAVAQERAERARQERSQLGVGEPGKRADRRRRPPRREAFLRARARLPGAGARGAARGSAPRVPGGTTVMPPGLRRSDAILHTTFEVPTPSEQVRLVVARTAVWIADATARARVKSRRDRAEVEVALVDPGALDARDDLARPMSQTAREYCR